MKTPQVEHGVLDPKTGEEITTPLGLRRIVPILREDNNLSNMVLKFFGSLINSNLSLFDSLKYNGSETGNSTRSKSDSFG